jgi:hypothetical protein
MQLRLRRRRRRGWRKRLDELVLALSTVVVLARALWRGWRIA